jgi:hypothetical protein
MVSTTSSASVLGLCLVVAVGCEHAPSRHLSSSGRGLGGHTTSNSTNMTADLHQDRIDMIGQLCNFSGGGGSVVYDAWSGNINCLGRTGTPCHGDSECDEESHFKCKGPQSELHKEYKNTCLGECYQ